MNALAQPLQADNTRVFNIVTLFSFRITRNDGTVSHLMVKDGRAVAKRVLTESPDFILSIAKKLAPNTHIELVCEQFFTMGSSSHILYSLDGTSDVQFVKPIASPEEIVWGEFFFPGDTPEGFIFQKDFLEVIANQVRNHTVVTTLNSKIFIKSGSFAGYSGFLVGTLTERSQELLGATANIVVFVAGPSKVSDTPSVLSQFGCHLFTQEELSIN